MAVTCVSVSAVRVGIWAGAVLGLAVSSAAQPPAPVAQAQEVRDELDKLRREFEAVRDAYGARLAALEAKLTAIGAPAADVPAAGAAVEVQVPAGAAGSGGPSGALPVYGNASAMSKIFNPDIAVIGNFVGVAGENAVNPSPALALEDDDAVVERDRPGIAAEGGNLHAYPAL